MREFKIAEPRTADEAAALLRRNERDGASSSRAGRTSSTSSRAAFRGAGLVVDLRA